MPTVDLPVLTKILPASVHKAIPERVATLLAHPTILALSAGITISPKGYGSWNLPISLLVERKGGLSPSPRWTKRWPSTFQGLPKGCARCNSP